MRKNNSKLNFTKNCRASWFSRKRQKISKYSISLAWLGQWSRSTITPLKSELDRKPYNKQRNYVVSLLRKEKKEFYGNLNVNVLTENRTFWKTDKPFLAEKSKKVSKSKNNLNRRQSNYLTR